VEVGLGLVAVLVGVAQVAVDLAIGTLSAKLKRKHSKIEPVTDSNFALLK